MKIWLIVFPFLWGCADKEAAGPCEEICTILVDDCGYSAFPSHGSCEQGCTYESGEGMNADGYLSCISAVEECDTYGMVGCDNAFGL